MASYVSVLVAAANTMEPIPAKVKMVIRRSSKEFAFLYYDKWPLYVVQTIETTPVKSGQYIFLLQQTKSL